MHYEILDEKRKNILPFLKNFKNNFYLAGGTALALQLGHRDSFDFDFFSKGKINTKKLFLDLEKIFANRKLLKVQEEENTLTVFIDDEVKLSFFGDYNYPLLEKTIDEDFFFLASITDIALMKFSAITSRSSSKDYVDLFFILKEISLKSLLEKLPSKFPSLEENLILKSLVYFEDIEKEPIFFTTKNQPTFDDIKKFLIQEVRNIK